MPARIQNETFGASFFLVGDFHSAQAKPKETGHKVGRENFRRLL